MKCYLIILCFLSCFVLTTGQDFAPPQLSEIPKQSQILIAGEDLVHFGDVIDVDIVGGFEFDWRGKLNAEGFLDGLDSYSDPIYGLCRSENQIASDITKVMGKILREPKVVVRIIDRSNRAVVRMDGAVRTATRFRVQRTVYLRELLVMAGGLTDGASGGITIFRPGNLSCTPTDVPVIVADSKPTPSLDNGSQTINIKISELLSGKTSANPQIFSGDMITVTRALPIYVIGAVNNPKPIYSRDRMTVSRIVASAGGLTKDAEGNKVTIFRRDGVNVSSIEADLIKIKSGETNDEVLRPFDIIEVASKGGGARKYPPVFANDENRDRSKQEMPLRIVD